MCNVEVILGLHYINCQPKQQEKMFSNSDKTLFISWTDSWKETGISTCMWPRLNFDTKIKAGGMNCIFQHCRIS